MVVKHNMQGMNTNRMLGLNTRAVSGVTEKLSSGYRINRAADDAAGLSISEKMRRQIRGLTQASTNAQDGISLVQTAEGGLNEVHDMIHRMNELSVKAATGTLTETDRSYIDQEVQQLKREINRVADTTTFNEIQLFPSDGSSSSMYTADYEVTLNPDGTYTSTLKNTYNFAKDDKDISSNAQALSDYLVNTLLPDAMAEVKAGYPSIDTGSDTLQINLKMSYIDGPNGTLGFAQYSYMGNSEKTPVESSFFIKIDTADFTDSNALTGLDRNDLLKSTVYHELTHSLMQYTMSKNMVSDFPAWFKEGVAQLSGGGFATGWNTGLRYIADELADGDDDSKDADIQNYLKSASVDSRPYGHGYLAAAYIGQLASGNDEVTADNIKSGIDAVLGAVKGGQTLEQAVLAKTGKSLGDITKAINGVNDDAVEFVRKLSKATGSGAGSIIYSGGLGAGSQLMGSLPSDGSTTSDLLAANTIFLQVGAEANTHIDVNLFSIGTKTLGLEDTNTLTAESASRAIDSAKSALEVVSTIRSYYGAVQNRLEHTINNIDNVVENTTAAESQIRDTDMATSMVEFANLQVLLQAGQSMLSTANQTNQGVLSLLQ